MLYNVEQKQTMLDALNTRVSSIVDVCVAMANEGYLINKHKLVKLSWSSILVHAFDNIDVLSNEQHASLERIYNNVMSL